MAVAMISCEKGNNDLENDDFQDDMLKMNVLKSNEEGLEGAIVTITSSDDSSQTVYQATTNDQGQCGIEEIAGGSYQCHVKASIQKRIYNLHTNFEIQTGQEKTLNFYPDTVSANVTFIVKDSLGKPVEGVSTLLYQGIVIDDLYQMISYAWFKSQTNNNG